MRSTFDNGVKGRLRLELNDGKAITIRTTAASQSMLENGNRIVIGGASGMTTIEAASTLESALRK